MASASIVTERLELVALPPALLEATLSGNMERARELAPFAVLPGWPGDSEGLLRRRLERMRADNTAEQWLARAMVLRTAERPVVGNIGFHGPPGTNAINAAEAVELGYRVDSNCQRRGYAMEGVRALIAWATAEHGMRRFLASISPTNEASLALVAKLGFVYVSTVWDDEDGEERVFELRG